MLNNNPESSPYYHFHFLGIVFCFWFSMFVYMPAFGIYLEQLEFGYAAAGTILGSYGIMQILVRFPLGAAADRFQLSGKMLVSAGFAASLTSAAMLALGVDFAPIFLGRLLAGITSAMWVVLTIWYSSSFDKSQSIKAMGRLQATMVCSQLISMALSGWLADLLGFTGLFWVGGGFALVGLVLVLVLPKIRKQETKTVISMNSPLTVFKDWKLWLPGLLSLFAHAVLFITIFGFSSVYFHRINPDPKAIVWLVIAFMFPHAAASFLTALKKRSFHNPHGLLSLCFGIGAVALLFMGQTADWIVYCTLHAVLGFALGIVFPILLDFAYQSGKDHGSNTAMGFYQSVYSIGIVGGPIAAGYAARLGGMGPVFYLSAVFLAVGAVLIFLKRGSLRKAGFNRDKRILYWRKG